MIFVGPLIENNFLNFFFNVYDRESPNITANLIEILGSIGGSYGAEQVGKKKSGRLLDGIEHNGFPA